MLVYGFVPAKSNSRRLPGKNLKNLASMPLFMHSVLASLNSTLISETFVSSDSNEILRIAKKNGATGLKRQKSLCQDSTTNFEVLKNFCFGLYEKNELPSIIALLQPTQPFRTSHDLDNMLDVFISDKQHDSAVTVKKSKRVRGWSVNHSWKSERSGNSGFGRLQTNNVYEEITGHLILIKPERTVMKGSLLGSSTRSFLLPEKWYDVDIDEESDWRVAEIIAHRLSGGEFE